ncbi:MAG: hypothetical protein LBK22_04470 [Tannerella sp.]|nr:hypothetical protein [Tannerella sp.]
MRTVSIIFAGAWPAIYAQCVYGQSRQYPVSGIDIRDPFIVADARNGILYYRYDSPSQKGREGHAQPVKRKLE